VLRPYLREELNEAIRIGAIYSVVFQMLDSMRDVLLVEERPMSGV